MKKVVVVACFATLFSSLSLYAQTAEQLRVQQQFFYHYGKVYQKGVSGTGLTGPQYLYDDWRPMKIKNKDFEVDMAAVKMNLHTSMLEVMYEGEEKLIYPKDIEYVSFKEEGISRKFYPAQRYSYGKTPLEGFMEVAGDEPEQILVHHYTGIKEPGPSANIVGGPTDNVLVKTSKIYISASGKLIPVKNKKQFAKYFKGRSKKAEALMKERKTDFKNPYQLYEVLRLVRE